MTMYDYPSLFWAALSASIFVCCVVIWKALRNPQRLLEWPVVVCVMWLYFYGYMAVQAVIYLRPQVPQASMLGLGEVVPLTCLIGILWGWNVALRRGLPPTAREPIVPFRTETLWWFGVLLILLGAAGTYSLGAAIASTEQRGDRFNWSAVSGYWTLLFHVGYPGMALALWSMIADRRHKWLSRITFTVAIAGFITPFIMNARRGPVFPLVIILLYLPPLIRKVPPRRAFILGGLLVAGLTMLALNTARHWIVARNWGEAADVLTPEQILVSRTLRVEDNEFINNVYMIAALNKTGKYQFGTGHLSLLTHWVPRAVWPGKPALGEGWYPPEELAADVNAVAGRSLLGGGAAATGVADSFVQYGFLAPLFWFAIAWIIGRVYVRAASTNNPRIQICYVGLLCASHWLISQSFSEAFVPATTYQVVPLIAFALFRVRRRSVALPAVNPPTQSTAPALPQRITG
jgi:hypothetical protein